MKVLHRKLIGLLVYVVSFLLNKTFTEIIQFFVVFFLEYGRSSSIQLAVFVTCY